MVGHETVSCHSLLLLCLHCPFIANASTAISKALYKMCENVVIKEKCIRGFVFPYPRKPVEQTFLFPNSVEEKRAICLFFSV